nr:ABC transporter ATP-binding protein [Tissierella sp.]
MIKIENLSKAYGSTQVLRDINLELEEGKIYGLLGRNGVGKTTFLNIISNLIVGDSGRVTFNGEDVYENSKALENIAIVKEDGFGIGDIKVRELFKSARIVYKNWDEEYAKILIKEFKLDIKKNYSKLSRGNKTIVGLIIGLASRAPLTLFDEPSLGLDAAFRYKFYNLLLEDAETNPRTVIISTHLIDEVTNLFEEVIILKDEEVYLKEEVEKLMEDAYFLSGKLENMKKVIASKRVISKEEFGTINIVGIFDSLSKEEKDLLKENAIEISAIPLQKLFVLLTQDELEEVR